MTAIIQLLLRLGLPIMAGWGLSDLSDKIFMDKNIPTYPEGGIKEGLTIKKLLWLIVISAIAAFLMKFIGRKFNIKILK